MDELAKVESADDDAFVRWSKIRFNRILADYLLRSDRHDTAELLARTADIHVRSIYNCQHASHY